MALSDHSSKFPFLSTVDDNENSLIYLRGLLEQKDSLILKTLNSLCESMRLLLKEGLCFVYLVQPWPGHTFCLLIHLSVETWAMESLRLFACLRRAP